MKVVFENGGWLGGIRASLTRYVLIVSCRSARVLFGDLCSSSALGNSCSHLYDAKLLPTDNNEDAPLSGRESGP